MKDNDPEFEKLDKNFKKGVAFYNENKYDEALNFINKSIKKDGEHYLKTYYLAVSYQGLLKFGESIQLLNKVLEQGKHQFFCLFALTLSYKLIGDYKSSLDAYTKLLKLDIDLCNNPQRFKILELKLKYLNELKSKGVKSQLEDSFERGLYAYNSGKIDDAISHFQKYLEEEPDFPLAHYYKSGAYVQNGDFENALESMEKFTELYPHNIEGWISRALIHSQIGEYEEAIENGNKALELEPKSTRIKNHLDSFYKIQKRIENKTDEEKSEELVRMGLEELKKESFQKALQYFNAATKLNIKNREAWDGKIQCVDIEDQIEIYHKVLEIFPDDSHLWYKTGIWYNKWTQSNKALEYFDKAIKLDVKNRSAWDSKIKFVDEKSQIELYHKVLEIFPEDSLFWYETGVWYRKSKQPKKAIEYYEKAIELDKDNIGYNAWDAMGNAYLDMKEYNKAIESYKKVIQHRETYSDSNVYTKIGDLCLKMNNTNDAIKNYQKALKFERPNRSALPKLNKLKKKRF